MPPKKNKIFHHPIESLKKFEELVNTDEEKNEGLQPIVIIDCHLDWCGPCEAMVPNYQTIWFTYE